jgi:hypothetical protein
MYPTELGTEINPADKIDPSIPRALFGAGR